jgi:hypothetical protein
VLLYSGIIIKRFADAQPQHTRLHTHVSSTHTHITLITHTCAPALLPAGVSRQQPGAAVPLAAALPKHHRKTPTNDRGLLAGIITKRMSSQLHAHDISAYFRYSSWSARRAPTAYTPPSQGYWASKMPNKLHWAQCTSVRPSPPHEFVQLLVGQT